LNIEIDSPSKKVITIKGRQISLGECKFIFSRIWKYQAKEHYHAKNEKGLHYHPDKATQVRTKDLFHVLDLAGRLLNKEEIHGDDSMPC
jgi:hypothetical protein